MCVFNNLSTCEFDNLLDHQFVGPRDQGPNGAKGPKGPRAKGSKDKPTLGQPTPNIINNQGSWQFLKTDENHAENHLKTIGKTLKTCENHTFFIKK